MKVATGTCSLPRSRMAPRVSEAKGYMLTIASAPVSRTARRSRRWLNSDTIATSGAHATGRRYQRR